MKGLTDLHLHPCGYFDHSSFMYTTVTRVTPTTISSVEIQIDSYIDITLVWYLSKDINHVNLTWNTIRIDLCVGLNRYEALLLPYCKTKKKKFHTLNFPLPILLPLLLN